MKVLIQLTQLDKKETVLRSLQSSIQTNNLLQQQILANGILFDKQTKKEITALKERLATIASIKTDAKAPFKKRRNHPSAKKIVSILSRYSTPVPGSSRVPKSFDRFKINSEQSYSSKEGKNYGKFT